MKRLITILLLTVFCVSIFASSILALQWDYATGPNLPERANVERAFPSGDDDPWVDVEKIGERKDSISYGFVNFYCFSSITPSKILWILPQLSVPLIISISPSLSRLPLLSPAM